VRQNSRIQGNDPLVGSKIHSTIIEYYYRVIPLESMGAYGRKHNCAGGLGKASRILKLGFEGRLGIFWANKVWEIFPHRTKECV